MSGVFPELPKVSFKFSLDIATVYAIEMALHTHKIKMRVEKQPFSEELLEEWREALSLPNLFWHLRAFMCGRGISMSKLRDWENILSSRSCRRA
ncbi:MAG: hypothetical protein DSO07_07185 [Thermoproteota archaeon]|uniref:Uncharacterized protein n=1 Tax=Candidatus Methanodesulfokora washburnensis TaxID=2478471 RepID=A0A3R9PE19_9CREN|nr:hypothetical protein [Candidatus Methanodesulfokores washburnensis]RSN71481.1 hypothetical protein D6D85_15875 [Candidatus Methanodesulfokores washburnensis]RZN61977.1 MAG: hypothetical protein EF810_03940 [Candidatus Methanodesulfokores washburnensis]TDA40948.1 MAG: hypothetical protein DSO07_07185 [Candidatus Korarchaeota archaeon]